MLIKNVNIYTEEKKFVPGMIVIKDGQIEAVLDENAHVDTASQEEILDGKGNYAIPGLIDLHFHGCKGYDFCDGTMEALEAIAQYEASVGVTAICPATMTLPVSQLEDILAVGAGSGRGV